MSQTLSVSRRISYALVPLILLVAARFDLGHALIAGLFTHMILDQTERGLSDAGASPRVARWSALGLFAVIVILLAVVFASFIEIGVFRLPLFIDRVLPRLDHLAGLFGMDLPVENVIQLRDLVLHAAKENARSVTATSGLLTRGFFQIAAAIAIAALKFLASKTAPASAGLEGEVRGELSARLALFAASFELVMGAQVMIAAINTALAGVFLFALRIPFRTMLTLTTFVCGMVPIAGNLVSNALIVAAALTLSDKHALAALIFLIVVHKGEYFLNGRIIGARIAMPLWATLAGLLIGEALMGVTGVILAPTLIYYLREELRAIPARTTA